MTQLHGDHAPRETARRASAAAASRSSAATYAANAPERVERSATRNCCQRTRTFAAVDRQDSSAASAGDTSVSREREVIGGSKSGEGRSVGARYVWRGRGRV